MHFFSLGVRVFVNQLMHLYYYTTVLGTHAFAPTVKIMQPAFAGRALLARPFVTMYVYYVDRIENVSHSHCVYNQSVFRMEIRLGFAVGCLRL